MIIVNENTSRWLKELARFLPLKSLLFLHGNILDLVTFPVQEQGSDAAYWVDDELPRFLRRYLMESGYRVVGFVDPVDGLSFPDKRMESDFKALAQGKPVAREGETTYTAEPADKQSPAQEAAPRRPSSPLEESLASIRRAVANTETPCAFVFTLASRLVTSPQNILRDERALLTGILKASLECADIFGPDGSQRKNTILLICDKLNDLPPFLYVNNPRACSIRIDKPDSRERARFLQRNFAAFHGGAKEKMPSGLAARFAALTEGLANYELLSLVHLSRRESIPVADLDSLCQRYKYGVLESEWDKLDRDRLAGAGELLRSRVKGQEEAVCRVLDIVKRARIGLAAGQSHGAGRPRGVLFFAGPTGVGKTELAKSLAELLFGRQDRCIRFDMSEFSAPQSDEKLLGAPPGYVGYEEGGQLTNAMKDHPFSILLFDEVEKAHPRIFDKFLQILDDGRLTDGKGETVYFSEAVIIFTSNLGAVSQGGEDSSRRMLVTPDMDFEAIGQSIRTSIQEHFNFVLGRPEILNRIGDNFVVFDFIRPPADEHIVDLLVARLAASVRAKWKASLTLAPPVRETLLKLARNRLHHGGRGIRNMLDASLVNSLTRFLFDHAGDSGKDARAGLAGAEILISSLVDHGPKAPARYEVLGEIKRP